MDSNNRKENRRFPDSYKYSSHSRGLQMLKSTLSLTPKNALAPVQLGKPKKRSSESFKHPDHHQILDTIIKKWWNGKPDDLFEFHFWADKVKEISDKDRFKDIHELGDFVHAIMAILFDDENNRHMHKVFDRLSQDQRASFNGLLFERRQKEMEELAAQANANMGSIVTQRKERKFGITLSPRVRAGCNADNVKAGISPSKHQKPPPRFSVTRLTNENDELPRPAKVRRSSSKPPSLKVEYCDDKKDKIHPARVERSSSKVPIRPKVLNEEELRDLLNPPVPEVITTYEPYEDADTEEIEEAEEAVSLELGSDSANKNGDKENCSGSDEEDLKKYVKPPSGPPLTQAMLEEINAALEKPAKEVVVSGFSLKVLQEDLVNIHDVKEWLIDVNIDFYLELIRERSKLPGYPRVYVFYSFFFPLLHGKDQGGGYGAVEETTGDEDIFEYDLIFIPINSQHHWRLIVVECSQRRLMSYDSMQHDNSFAIREIGKYLNREHKRKHPNKYSEEGELLRVRELNNNAVEMEKETVADGTPEIKETKRKVYVNREDWVIQQVAENLPLQTNAIDCGIFILQYAEYLSRRKEFDFDQSHIPYFRKRMVYETLTKTLLTSI